MVNLIVIKVLHPDQPTHTHTHTGATRPGFEDERCPRAALNTHIYMDVHMHIYILYVEERDVGVLTQ